MTPQRIVVLNGSATQALLYAHMLEQHGATVTVTADVETALAALAGNPPDAVLVDAGFAAAAARLRAASPVPALVLLGGSAPADVTDVHTPDAGDPEALAGFVSALLAEREAPPPVAEVFRRARMLIVDDSVTYREFLRMELEEEGSQVDIARNAEEAVQALTESLYDAVIIDLIMPGTGGNQLCESFDRFRRRRGLFFQIVILTSQEGDDQASASLQAGADDFIGKSKPLEVFKMRLMALLRRKYLVEDTLRRQRNYGQTVA